MNTPKHKQLNTQIYSEASDWLIEFRSGDIDAAGRKEFYNWLHTSPEHMRAYLELAAIWNEGIALDQSRTFDDRTLMAAIHPEDNITSFPARVTDSRSGLPDHSPVRGDGRGASVRVFAIAASILVGALGTWYWYAYARHTYGTSVGEQRMLTLNDGSTIELDSRSRVRVRFSESERDVDLLDGQALFHVAKNSARPFVVYSASTRVRAVGTQFDVYRKPSATTVTVVEGTVAVLPDRLQDSNPRVSAPSGENPHLQTRSSNAGDRLISPPFVLKEGEGARSSGNGEVGPAEGTAQQESEMLLSAGEQAIITAQATVKQIQPDVSTATAWTRHQLVFRGTSLQQVADEFNRYNQRHLVIHDPQIGDLKVTGIFSSTDPASFIRFLEARADIVVTQEGDEILVARKP
jgi:transmembrane sensor